MTYLCITRQLYHMASCKPYLTLFIDTWWADKQTWSISPTALPAQAIITWVAWNPLSCPYSALVINTPGITGRRKTGRYVILFSGTGEERELCVAWITELSWRLGAGLCPVAWEEAVRHFLLPWAQWHWLQPKDVWRCTILYMCTCFLYTCKTLWNRAFCTRIRHFEIVLFVHM